MKTKIKYTIQYWPVETLKYRGGPGRKIVLNRYKRRKLDLTVDNEIRISDSGLRTAIVMVSGCKNARVFRHRNCCQRTNISNIINERMKIISKTCSVVNPSLKLAFPEGRYLYCITSCGGRTIPAVFCNNVRIKSYAYAQSCAWKCFVTDYSKLSGQTDFEHRRQKHTSPRAIYIFFWLFSYKFDEKKQYKTTTPFETLCIPLISIARWIRRE